jgi:hypothetical protein
LKDAKAFSSLVEIKLLVMLPDYLHTSKAGNTDGKWQLSELETNCNKTYFSPLMHSGSIFGQEVLHAIQLFLGAASSCTSGGLCSL